MLRPSWISAVVLLCGLVAGLTRPAAADSVYYEDPVLGVTVSPVEGVVVFSDGEVPIDPLNIGVDTSDYISLSGSGWSQAQTSTWTQLSGENTWYLPEIAEGTAEPVGTWINSNFAWDPSVLQTITIFEADGTTLSDVITIANIGGNAAVTFASDPTPLPSTWTMMLIGLAGLGFVTYRQKKNARSFAAA